MKCIQIRPSPGLGAIAGATFAAALAWCIASTAPHAQNAYITNSGSNTVSVLNTATNTLAGSPIAVGTLPYGVAVNPVGRRVYVTNHLSNTVSVIDATSNVVIGSPIAVGVGPYGVAVAQVAGGFMSPTISPTRFQ